MLKNSAAKKFIPSASNSRTIAQNFSGALSASDTTVQKALETLDAAIVSGGVTASNVGVSGVGVFKQKAGTVLQFNNINAGSSKITVTLDSGNNEVDVDVDPSQIATSTLNNDAGFISNVVEDTTPQLGGNLDANSFGITFPSGTYTDILDDDTFATATATTGASSESIKAYVDAQVATVDTWAEILAIGNTTGGTNAVVSAGDTLTVDTITETTPAAGVNIQDNVIIGAGEAGIDYTFTFNGETNDGVLTWMEDEDYFKFDDDVFMLSGESIYFGATNVGLYSSVGGVLTCTAATADFQYQIHAGSGIKANKNASVANNTFSSIFGASTQIDNRQVTIVGWNETSGIGLVLKKGASQTGAALEVHDASDSRLAYWDNNGDIYLYGTSNPTIVLSEAGSTTSYMHIQDQSANQCEWRKVADTGNSTMFIQPICTDGSSNATLGLFRATNTTGTKRFLMYNGDATSTVDNQFGVDGTNSFFNGGGMVGIETASPHSGLHVNTSFALPYVAKTGTYTITASDYTVDCTSGTFNVTLPTAASIAGRIYQINNSGTGTITVDTTSSQTINGDLTIDLIQYEQITVQSTGSNWILIH